MNILVLIAIIVTFATVIPALRQIWLHHPRALFVLFFVEMWERFSYYGMRSLLILYLSQHLLLGDQVAAAQFSSFSTLVYLLPLIGGFAADRIVGMQRAILMGGILLILGHGLMAVEGPPARQILRIDQATYVVERSGGAEPGVQVVMGGRPHRLEITPGGTLRVSPKDGGEPTEVPGERFKLETVSSPALFSAILYLALAAIALGIGLLKSNISALVGQLYAASDPRRDAGFTLYFYGINLGAFWAAAACGWLGLEVGWWAGFGAAGLGMAIGLAAFVLGRNYVDRSIQAVATEGADRLAAPPRTTVRLSRRDVLAWAAALCALPAIAWLIQARLALGAGVAIVIVGAIIYAVLQFVRTQGAAERRNILVIAMMILAATVFYVAFQQSGSSVLLFSARHVDLTFAATNYSLPLPWGSLVFGPEAPAAGDAAIWIDSKVTASQLLALNAGFVILLAPLAARLWSSLARIGRDPGIAAKFGLALFQIGLCYLVIAWARPFVSPAFLLPIWAMVLHSLFHTTAELCLAPVGQSRVSKLSPPKLLGFFMATWLLSSAIAQYVGGFLAGLAATSTIAGQSAGPQQSFDAALQLFSSLGWAMAGIGAAALCINGVVWWNRNARAKEG